MEQDEQASFHSLLHRMILVVALRLVVYAVYSCVIILWICLAYLSMQWYWAVQI